MDSNEIDSYVKDMVKAAVNAEIVSRLSKDSTDTLIELIRKGEPNQSIEEIIKAISENYSAEFTKFLSEKGYVNKNNLSELVEENGYIGVDSVHSYVENEIRKENPEFDDLIFVCDIEAYVKENSWQFDDIVSKSDICTDDAISAIVENGDARDAIKELADRI